MKKFFNRRFVFAGLLVLLMVLISVVPVLAFGGDNPQVQLTAEQQVVITSVISSAVLVVLRLIVEFSKKTKMVVTDSMMRWIVLGISCVVALMFFRFSLPSLPVLVDPSSSSELIVGYVTDVTKLLIEWFLYSFAVYEVLFRTIKDKIGELTIPSVYHG